MNSSHPYAAFFDLDGTLATGNQPPASRDVEAIRAFRAAGNYAFLCTGRSTGYLYREILDIGFDGIVAGAGAHVTVGDEVIYRRSVDPEVLDRLMRRFEITDHTLIMETETAMIQLASSPAAGVIDRYPRILCADEWPERYADQVVSKLTIYGYPMAADLRQAVEEHLSLIEHPRYYEAVPIGCSKSDGIRRVIERLDVPQENVVAMGDSPNDRDMIAYAGFGVVMGDGDPSIQAIADYVTLPLAECGVAHALERFQVAPTVR